VFYHDNWQKVVVKNWDTGYKQTETEEVDAEEGEGDKDLEDDN
jgi:hypothetical protein